ncbi:hypothetical protein Tco_0368267, partial [Tanacetum coccineum]
HLAPADSTVIASPAIDHVPSVDETETFKTDEFAATPPPPAYHTTSRMFEVGESFAAAARQSGSTVARKVDYSFVDTRDHDALCDEVDTLRRYLSSLCTTHEQERVRAHQALDRSEAHNKALEARIAVLETQAYRHEWQHQDADDHATRSIMRI